MAEKWQPVIDYSKCTKCGYCIDLCANAVFDRSKSPEPVVKYPGNCIEGCQYCGVMCASNAINYFDGVNEYKCKCNHFCIGCG
ncbi:MAG: 4Fe-4S binding protein [Actinobacteria bacterium]|nr:4Fe-4S binding protein [Actinomycetota bacterium]